MQRKFIGRKQELAALSKLWQRNQSSMVVISGRRRIGKSRLIAEFAKDKRFINFSGLAPHPQMQAQEQRQEFMRKLAEHFAVGGLASDDWGSIFSLLASLLQTTNQPTVVAFDEISWMAIGDKNFLGKLKTVWDESFSKNPQLMLFLCSSVSSWIEKNILRSTGLLGRPSLHIKLGELSLQECNDFWHDDQHQHISSYEKLKLLSVTGGVPRYLELADPKEPAEHTIRALCFTQHAPLQREFELIFADVYGKRSLIYQKVVTAMVSGYKTQEDIAKKLGILSGGDLTEYLNDLIQGGFVRREYTWNIAEAATSRLSKYRLQDNFSRFYLQYMESRQSQISHGLLNNLSLRALPGWDSFLGLQFENLILNNRQQIIQQLHIDASDIVYENPFFQRKTQRQPGCQIDYMIQTRHDEVYVCEIKFQREAIGLEIITEMQQKMARLKLPRSMSRRAVLIHVNGVKSTVIDAHYFYGMIDFESLLR